MRKWINEKIFSSNKNTLIFVSLIALFALFIYQIVLFCYGTYFNSNSDDVSQYTNILVQYIENLKKGDLSYYNFSNSSGASIFADAYYVPIDIFTLLTFLLSFVLNTTVAFSIVNLSKVLLGIVVFTYFLQRKGFKNWIVCLLSLMYFVFGGSWTFSVYSTYFSLFFYLPFSLLVIDLFVKGKKWTLPLYSFILVLYNFYNAYTLFIFMVFVYLVIKIRDDYSTFRMLIKDVIVFSLNLLLGVIMAFVVFVPSVLYIINYTVRTEVGDFQVLFDFDIYIRMLSKLFMYEAGTTTFFLHGGYIQGHFNYYVGTLGLFLLGLMFNMKDRDSKIYKYSLLAVMVMMVIPLVSMIFSGVSVAYTRWFNFINIILLYMIGHVLSNCDDIFASKNISIRLGVIIISLYIITLLLTIIYFVSNRDVYGDYYKIFMQLIYFVLFGSFLIMNVVFFLGKRKDLLFSVFAVEMVVVMCVNFSIAFGSKRLDVIKNEEEIIDILNQLDVKENSLQRVYVVNDNNINFARKTDSLVNEETFHSFFTKYIYDYVYLYRDSSEGLMFRDFDRMTPYSSRVMDYKYFVVDKEDINYELDYMSVIYEDEKYIIYENDKYNDFYVYENYYKENDVKVYNDKSDLILLEKNLFLGVVLEGNNYNLNSIEYSNQFNNRVDVIEDLVVNKNEDDIYEFNVDKYKDIGYENVTIYLKNDKFDSKLKINTVSIDGEVKQCDNQSTIYKCSIDETIENIILDGDISSLKYSVVVSIEDDNYSIALVENNQGDNYLHYYSNIERDVFVVNDSLDKRKCFGGICVVKDFEVNHVLIRDSNEIYNDGILFFIYNYDNLEYYMLNGDDNLASNKELTYNKSTINIKYTRESVSEYDQVVVLPVTYSDEWEIEGNNGDYKLVKANGGFLGILVENGIKNVDVSITFKPTGMNIGLIGSFVGFGIYGLYCTVLYLKGKRDKDENI